MSGEEKNLELLPVELLQQIFQYLDAAFLIHNVKLVCRRFYILLSDESFWRHKLLGGQQDGCLQERRVLVGLGVAAGAGEHPGVVRFRPLSREPGWSDVCYREAVEKALWTRHPIHKTVLAEPHYAPIDALQLFGNGACVTGGRDRILAVWGPEGGTTPLAVDAKRHTGWVWDVATPPQIRHQPSHFYSCAWDSTVVQWNVRESALEPVCSRFTTHPGLCAGCWEGVVAVGLSVPKVALIDTRLAVEGACASFRAHTRAVTGLHLYDYLVVSISEDRSLWATDLRNMACPLAKVEVEGMLPEGGEGTPAHPRSLTRCRNIYYVGDTRGGLHLINSTSGEYKHDVFYPCVAQRSITGLAATLSTLTVGSLDKTVRIFSMVGTCPELITEWTMNGEVTGLDYNGEILAVATTDNSASLYKPNHGTSEPTIEPESKEICNEQGDH